MDEVEDVQVATVGVGMLGLGNKGAVAASLRLNERFDCCFVCSHLAAHQDQVAVRNQNFHDITRLATFERVGFGEDEDEPAAADEDSMWSPVVELFEAATASIVQEKSPRSSKSILDHHCIIWLGDLNYRLASVLTKETCAGFLTTGTPDAHTQLLYYDQLCREKSKCEAFSAFQEASVLFAPTYKYTPGTGTLDTSKRMPAWCDRVLWRDASTMSRWQKEIAKTEQCRVYDPGSPAHNTTEGGGENDAQATGGAAPPVVRKDVKVTPLLYGSLPGGLFSFIDETPENGADGRPPKIDTEQEPTAHKVEFNVGASEQETLWMSDHLPVFCALSFAMPTANVSPSARRRGLSPIGPHRALGSVGFATIGMPVAEVTQAPSFFSWS
jgi:hypothetical protein